MQYFKDKIGLFLLVCAFIFLTFGCKLSFTGNSIQDYFSNNIFIPHIIGIILLFVSLLILTASKSLDAVIIPSGGFEKSVDRARIAGEKEAKYYLISGYIDKGKPIKESQAAAMYNELRKYGIKPSKMKIEGEAKDSLDNIIYSINKLKGLKKIGIVSYPEHLKRFEYIVNKAKKEGIIDEDVEIVKIPTKENAREKMYGIFGNIKEKYRLRKGINKTKEKKAGFFGQIMKKLIDPDSIER
jgi:uncharacterized SAM-binding protein YcdF (DUF218 family)